MTRRARRLLKALIGLDPALRRLVFSRMHPGAFCGFRYEWSWRGHKGQHEPAGGWRVWLLRAGRGFGKTRAGAEWVWARVRAAAAAGRPLIRIALVGANLGEVVKVMVKGRGGLIAAARADENPVWAATERVLRFPSGAEACAFSAERPDSLRGFEHDFAWCDELAKWSHPDETWDNLMLGLRTGERPRVLVTTTPRPVPLIQRIRALDRFVETRGHTIDNLHSSEDYRAEMVRIYGGTRLGRQELEGELFEEVAGSLWPRALIEEGRTVLRYGASAGSAPTQDERREFFRRIVVGVDPPAGAEGVCGISVCGLGRDGILYVLEDKSEAGLSPEGWARRVAGAAERWGADRVVAEANNGGDMVMSVLRNVAPRLPVRLVHASRGKVPRAEPIAALFETGEAKFAGRFPALEDELAGMTAAGLYQGPGRSPDRADAMVWAMTELSRPKPEPRIRTL
jgi:phage terminase large subunit-like protein